MYLLEWGWVQSHKKEKESLQHNWLKCITAVPGQRGGSTTTCAAICSYRVLNHHVIHTKVNISWHFWMVYGMLCSEVSREATDRLNILFMLSLETMWASTVVQEYVNGNQHFINVCLPPHYLVLNQIGNFFSMALESIWPKPLHMGKSPVNGCSMWWYRSGHFSRLDSTCIACDAEEVLQPDPAQRHNAEREIS